MPIARKRKSENDRDGYWYETERHKNQQRNMRLLETPGWFWCDADSFYRDLFPEGFLQRKGSNSDGKPNIIVLEDTGADVDNGLDAKGNKLVKRVMHRYTVHDDLDELESLRAVSIAKNTFMFLSPISYYGKSRSSRNARYLHAIMIDLDYVGERELANLLHQMERGVIPFANYLVSSGTGLHVVYRLESPVPLMTRYVAGLQVLKRELTDRVWNAHTSASDPDKKQNQGIFQAFRMVGSATKLNGEIGNPKLRQPYAVECFSHDATPPATIPYLLSFVPKLKGKGDMEALDALLEIGKESRTLTPMEDAKSAWPEWYERRILNDEPRKGWTFGRSGYDRVLEVIREQVSVSHRYWCIFYLAVMANKCGVPYDELEDDAYGLLERFDSLSTEPGNRFTANDVAAALEAFEGGVASGRARRYTQEFCERHAAVSYGEKLGVRKNPPDKRLPIEDSLDMARHARDLKQRRKGTNWWDGGNRGGAPEKAMQVWKAAYENPEACTAAIARAAGVSRPTVYKWLGVKDWRARYEAELARTSGGVVKADPALEFERDAMAGAGFDLGRGHYRPVGGFDREVVEAVVENPWKSYEEIAAMLSVPGADDIEEAVERNRELYNMLMLGLDPEEHARPDERA